MAIQEPSTTTSTSPAPSAEQSVSEPSKEQSNTHCQSSKKPTQSAQTTQTSQDTQSAQSAQSAKTAKYGLGLTLAVICVFVGISAAWGIYDSISGSPRIWGLFGFEIVSLVACMFGVLVGLGRFHEAKSLAAFNIALTFFVAATLGRFSAIATQAHTTLSEGQIVSNLLHDPMFEGRLTAAALIGLIAIGMAFGSARTSWKKLGIGIGLGIPVLVAFGWLAGSGKTWLLSGETAGASMLRMVVGIVGGVLLTILTASSVEQIIGAFVSRLPALPTLAPTAARKKKRSKPTKKA